MHVPNEQVCGEGSLADVGAKGGVRAVWSPEGGEPVLPLGVANIHSNWE